MVPSARQARKGMDFVIASTVRRMPPHGLLSFRYMDGIVLKVSTGDDWEASRNKVAAGVNPAAIAALVRC